MKAFERYLKDQGFSNNSIQRKVKHLTRYHKWLQSNQFQELKFDYSKAILYLEWERKNHIAKPTLLHYINHVKQYYNFLIQNKKIDVNPFDNIQIKNKIGVNPKVLLQELLKPKQLELILNAYKQNLRLNKRDKILLAILIYQGIAVPEIQYPKIKHLDLQKATINIPPSKMYAARKIPLQSPQIFDLTQFILNKSPEQNIFQYKNQTQATNSRTHLCQQIRKEIKKQQIDLRFINLQQIRKSIIVQWVKEHNLRKAQYLAGHRSIFSTEQYQVQNIEQLAEQINKYHPLELLNQKHKL